MLQNFSRSIQDVRTLHRSELKNSIKKHRKYKQFLWIVFFDKLSCAAGSGRPAGRGVLGLGVDAEDADVLDGLRVDEEHLGRARGER